jgi:hypothetical protein
LKDGSAQKECGKVAVKQPPTEDRVTG